MKNLVFAFDLIATFVVAYVGYEAFKVTYEHNLLLGICTAIAFAIVVLNGIADWLEELVRRLQSVQS